MVSLLILCQTLCSFGAPGVSALQPSAGPRALLRAGTRFEYGEGVEPTHFEPICLGPMYTSRRLILGVLLWMLTAPAAALAQTHDVPLRLTALFRSSAVPVVIHEIDGPRTLPADEETVFSARTNLDVASLPVTIRWDFGDGATGRSIFARHRFAEPGTYRVALRLSNAHGTATDSLTVVVTPPRTDGPAALPRRR